MCCAVVCVYCAVVCVHEAVMRVCSRILDDMELYESGKPFSLSQLASISHFLNHFVYRLVWSGYMGTSAG